MAQNSGFFRNFPNFGKFGTPGNSVENSPGFSGNSSSYEVFCPTGFWVEFWVPGGPRAHEISRAVHAGHFPGHFGKFPSLRRRLPRSKIAQKSVIFPEFPEFPEIRDFRNFPEFWLFFGKLPFLRPIFPGFFRRPRSGNSGNSVIFREIHTLTRCFSEVDFDPRKSQILGTRKKIFAVQRAGFPDFFRENRPAGKISARNFRATKKFSKISDF